jgi:hypothetical protein
MITNGAFILFIFITSIEVSYDVSSSPPWFVIDKRCAPSTPPLPSPIPSATPLLHQKSDSSLRWSSSMLYLVSSLSQPLLVIGL